MKVPQRDWHARQVLAGRRPTGSWSGVQPFYVRLHWPSVKAFESPGWKVYDNLFVMSDVAVGQNQWYHFGVGEFTTHRTDFRGWVESVLFHRVRNLDAQPMAMWPLGPLGPWTGWHRRMEAWDDEGDDDLWETIRGPPPGQKLAMGL